MKKHFILSILAGVFLASVPVLGMAQIGSGSLKNAAEEAAANVDDETKEAINSAVDQAADATLEARRTAIALVLDRAEEILTQVDENLNAAEFVSEDTLNEASDLLDSAMKELNTLQTQVAAADTSEKLAEARTDSIAWLQEHKDDAKTVMTMIYIDGLVASVDANAEAVKGMNALLPYFTIQQLDTATYAAALDTAETAVDAANTAVDALTIDSTRDTLEEASRLTADATVKVAIAVEEALTLSAQLDTETE